MSLNKLERAETFIAFALSLDAERGGFAPGRGVGGGAMARCIEIDKRCLVTVTPGHRIGMGRHYEDQVGQRIFPDTECRLFELQVYGKLVLVANLRGDDVQLHVYSPGLWESWFGIDNGGDTVSLDPWLVADDRDPRWQKLKQTADFRAPPLRTAPQTPPPAPMLSRRQKVAFGKAYAGSIVAEAQLAR